MAITPGSFVSGRTGLGASPPARLSPVPAATAAEEEGDASAAAGVARLLRQALAEGASDIHLEPEEAGYRVRLRLDGLLHVRSRLPGALGRRLVARLKVMAGLDIAERRLPQDGRIGLSLEEAGEVDFRLSTLPTLRGEKAVLRLLDRRDGLRGLDDLGLLPGQLDLLRQALARPHGMVLVTGPTGSGKTVTLYAALAHLNQESRHIATVEDPVEITLPGISQVPYNARSGLTFAVALRALLRQDPDVLMVGEIRDPETAEIAIKAAQTGHLVLSTLHTNDAPHTVTRLVHMGIAPYHITASVGLVVAQRLVRCLCPHCRQPLSLPPGELVRLGFAAGQDVRLYGPGGCGQCVGGYRGRTGIHEVMPLAGAVGEQVLAGGSARDIARAARQAGIVDMRQAGLAKVAAGITSLEEVFRVTVD